MNGHDNIILCTIHRQGSSKGDCHWRESANNKTKEHSCWPDEPQSARLWIWRTTCEASIMEGFINYAIARERINSAINSTHDPELSTQL